MSKIVTLISKFSYRIGLAAVAIGLILLFYIGMGLPESLHISETARTVSEAIRNLGDQGSSQQGWLSLASTRASVGITGLLKAFPLAFLYLVGGVNDLTSLLIPITSTLINFLLVSSLAARLYGRQAASLAGLLWIVLPVTLFTASAVEYTQPVAALFMGALLIYLRNKDNSKPRFSLIVLAFLGGVLFVFDSVAGLGLLVIITSLHTSNFSKPYLVWASPIIFMGILLIVYGVQVGQAFVLFYDNLVQMPEMAVLLPAIIIAFVLTIRENHGRSRVVFAIVGVCFVGLLLRYFLNFEAPLIADPLFSLILMAAILMLSNLFSRNIPPAIVDKFTLLAGVAFLGTAWTATDGQRLLIPSYAGTDWISTQTIFPILQILPGLILVLLVVFSQFQNNSKTKVTTILSIALPILIALAMLPFIWQRMQEYRPAILAVSQANDLLSEAELSLPIYVIQDLGLMRQLQYLNSEHGETKEQINWIESEDILEDIEGIENGYVFYWENDLQAHPIHWWQMGSFGTLGQPRLVLARTLSEEAAQNALQNATQAFNQSRTSKNYELMYGATINARQPCRAIRGWIESQHLDFETQAFLPLNNFLASNCFNLEEAENLLDKQDPSFYPSYFSIIYTGEARNLQEGAAFGQKYPFFQDPRTFYFEAILKPKAIYAYHVEIRGPEEIMPLYWRIGNYENYLTYGKYRDWTQFTVLFSTTDWDEDALKITLSPFLYHFNLFGGFIELRDLQLIEITETIIKE